MLFGEGKRFTVDKVNPYPGPGEYTPDSTLFANQVSTKFGVGYHTEVSDFDDSRDSWMHGKVLDGKYLIQSSLHKKETTGPAPASYTPKPFSSLNPLNSVVFGTSPRFTMEQKVSDSLNINIPEIGPSTPSYSFGVFSATTKNNEVGNNTVSDHD